MRLYVVSSCEDTVTGLRLAGIDGVFVADAKQAQEQIDRLRQDAGIGIVLINRELMKRMDDFVREFRKKYTLPLITEIPDTFRGTGSDSIARYVREAVGIRE